jgi:hypothetical protein
MSDIVRSTIYAGDAVANRGRNWGGAPDKWAARAYLVSKGETIPLIFTGAMIDEAANIAHRNPEDCGTHMPDRWRQIEADGAGWIYGASVVMAMACGLAVGLLF